jgi:hypothetical protein
MVMNEKSDVKQSVVKRLEVRIGELEEQFKSPETMTFGTRLFKPQPVYWKVGGELELTFLHYNDRDNMGLVRRLKREIQKDLQDKASNASNDEKVIIERQLAQTTKFNLNDCIMYETYKELEGIASYRFGKAMYGFGYYDNDRVGEIRINPCAPTEFLNNYRKVSQTVQRIAQKYGQVVAASDMPFHISFSMHSDVGGKDINLTNMESEDASELVMHATHGVLSFYSENPILLADRNTSSQGQYMTECHIDRISTLRMCKNRIEDRIASSDELLSQNILSLSWVLQSKEFHRILPNYPHPVI